LHFPFEPFVVGWFAGSGQNILMGKVKTDGREAKGKIVG
jgi:hypothetical protein